jgi:hypothetical protein
LRLLHHSPKHIASCFSVSLIAVVEAAAVRADNNHLGGQLLVFRLPFSIARSLFSLFPGLRVNSPEVHGP